MAAASRVPAAVYVRYVGDGDAYDLRTTIGPYRVVIELRNGEPRAVPEDTAALLTEPSMFETVDPVVAVDEIAEADRVRAEQQAEWEARQAAIQRAAQAAAPLKTIRDERIAVMRQAAEAAQPKAKTDQDVVVAAVAAAGEFDEALRQLNS